VCEVRVFFGLLRKYSAWPLNPVPLWLLLTRQISGAGSNIWPHRDCMKLQDETTDASSGTAFAPKTIFQNRKADPHNPFSQFSLEIETQPVDFYIKYFGRVFRFAIKIRFSQIFMVTSKNSPFPCRAAKRWNKPETSTFVGGSVLPIEQESVTVSRIQIPMS